MPLSRVAPRGAERRRRLARRARALDARRPGRARRVPRPTPTSDAAFPTAASASTPRAGTAIERVGGDELLFADGRSRGQPFLVLVTAPVPIGRVAHHRAARRRRPEATRGACGRAPAMQDARPRSFWRDMTGSARAARPPAPVARAAVSGSRRAALAHARRLDPPPRAARPRAVLRRRLGHARRLPGTVELLLALGPRRARPRPPAARLPQPERGRRLAAVVHVLRARARHPPRRLARRHRVLAAARARAVPARLRRRRAPRPRAALLPSRGEARAERTTRAGARRARARADRAARDPGHAARGLRPRRLERLAPAGRPARSRSASAARGP